MYKVEGGCCLILPGAIECAGKALQDCREIVELLLQADLTPSRARFQGSRRLTNALAASTSRQIVRKP